MYFAVEDEPYSLVIRVNEDPLGGKPGEWDRKLSMLLELLLPSTEAILGLGSDCTVTLSIEYRGFKDQMWGLHFTAKQLAFISAMRIEVDLDLYATGPELSD